jgi:carboxyl-terminal processing protease
VKDGFNHILPKWRDVKFGCFAILKGIPMAWSFKCTAIALFTLTFAVLGASFLPAAEQSAQTAWTANQSMRLYFEALAKIKTHALIQPDEQEIVRQSIKAYLRSIDPYSDYLTPDEFSAFTNAQQSQYVGLGMEIEKNAQGHVICFPYPLSPALKAGVAPGARLLAVEGLDVAAKALPAIGAMLLGQEGEKATLTIQNPASKPETLQIRRAPIATTSVVMETHGNLPLIKIISFRSDTLRKLAELLNGLSPSQPIVIDLRDNPGGDLYGSIDCAKMFLKKNQTVIQIQKPAGTESYQTEHNGRNLASPLYLWHNGHTASAAEVFCAALTQNQRAVSIGQQTYGKGTTQEIIKLSDGSAMIVTSGYLVAPNGLPYHEKGLAPDHPLTGAAAATKDFLAKVNELLGIRQKAALLPKPKMPLANTSQQSPKFVGGAPLPQLDIAVPAPDRHFICFDKAFESENAAESWAITLRYAYDRMNNQFLAQKGDRQYYICLGPYRSRQLALQKGRTMTQLTGLAVFSEKIKSAGDEGSLGQ